MASRLAACCAALQGLAWAQSDLKAILERVSEEAEVFQREAPNVVGRELLRHWAVQGRPRFRPRLGAEPDSPPQRRTLSREIVSEYGYSALQAAPESLREFRQVISVDGKELKAPEKARLQLAQGMRSEDDRQRRRMLEEFERQGTVGAAVDFGQILLLFRRRALADYEFTPPASGGWLGAERVLRVPYRQKVSGDSLHLYRGREFQRLPLTGEIWVRESDHLPLRITFRTEVAEGEHAAVYLAEVDYRESRYAVMLPAGALVRKETAGETVMENRYEYSGFRKFTVDAEIRFSFEDVPAKP